MKKWIVMILLVALCLGLVCCTGTDDPTDDPVEVPPTKPDINEKEIYTDAEGKYFKNFFHLNNETIDVSKIFHAVDPDNMVVSA